MPKTKRLTTYLGATLNPIYRFMTECELVVSPYDPKGNKLAKFLYTHMAYGDKRLKLPEFKLNVNFNEKIKNSELKVKYSFIIRKRLGK